MNLWMKPYLTKHLYISFSNNAYMKKKKPIPNQKKEIYQKLNKSMKKAEETIKRDYNKVKEDVKKLDTEENLSFFITYGWAVLLIIIFLGSFMWWQFFSIHSESCEFIEGSNLLCQNFDAINGTMGIEIRNLNNESITITEVKWKSCTISPEQNIGSNDRRSFEIPCTINSGRFKEKITVVYTIGNFQKHVIARVSKLVP
jgi:hypothetical protein|tara:strand:+ start:127 stop:726 length:600 start_codon:yes stop_codon:yes gene_type:complete